MYGKYGLPVEQNGEQRVKEISDGAYNAEFEEVMSYDRGKLEEVYVKNQKEREIY
jgi:hypothetical protein